MSTQGRREPNMGQICRISSFVKSKIDVKMLQFGRNYDVISKKKKVFTEILSVFLAKIRWYPKKKVFTVSKANGLPEANGPQGHCLPLRPCEYPSSFKVTIFALSATDNPLFLLIFSALKFEKNWLFFASKTRNVQKSFLFRRYKEHL